MKTKSICVVSRKGGVGKTASSANIAAELAQRGNKVLLVDLDPQTNATGYVDSIDSNSPTLYNVITENLDPASIIRPTRFDNLYILPSSEELEQIKPEVFSAKNEHLRLRSLLKAGYDYIIFDCPMGFNSFTPYGMAASDNVLVPVSVDQFGLEGFRQITQAIGVIKKTYNPEIKLLGSFLTMDDRTNINREVREALKTSLRDKFLNTSIRRSVKFKHSTFRNTPVVLYAPKSTVSRDYKDLVTEITNKL